jgi:hypothetical protein
MTREIIELDLGDLQPKKLARYTIKGRKYVLVEAGEGATAAWQNTHRRVSRMSDDGKFLGFDGGAEAGAELLAACLKDSETGRPAFAADTIRQWPTSVTQPMLMLLLRGSGLAAEEEQAPAAEGAEGNPQETPAEGGEGTPPDATEDTSASASGSENTSTNSSAGTSPTASPTVSSRRGRSG